MMDLCDRGNIFGASRSFGNSGYGDDSEGLRRPSKMEVMKDDAKRNKAVGWCAA
jgi:hypothetical protein